MAAHDIRPMWPAEESQVRAIFAICHPALPARAVGWYTAYPTLVAVDPEGDVMGFTSFSVSPSPTGPVTLWGNDLCVLPEARGQGVGWQLAEARVALGLQVGAVHFAGVAHVDNVPMARIFTRQGFHACQRLPAYWQGEDAMLWIGVL